NELERRRRLLQPGQLLLEGGALLGRGVEVEPHQSPPSQRARYPTRRVAPSNAGMTSRTRASWARRSQPSAHRRASTSRAPARSLGRTHRANPRAASVSARICCSTLCVARGTITRGRATAKASQTLL